MRGYVSAPQVSGVTLARIVAVIDCAHDPILEEVAWRRLVPFVSRGPVLTALVLNASANLRVRLQAKGVRVFVAEAQASPDWSTVRNLAAIARSVRATLLYANGEFAHLLCALTGPLLGISVVAHLLHDVSLIDAQAFVLCSSTVIVASEFARSQALSVGCKDVVVVPTPALDGLVRRAPDPESLVVGWAGAWRNDDDPQSFLRAALALLQDFPRIQFRMAISDPTAVPYNALPPRLRGRITFTPLVFGPQGFTGDIDLFVNTARRDPAHVTLTDALAAGIPAIATTASGSSELATTETRIQLYRAGDDDALGAAIARAYLGSHSDDGGGPKPRSTIDDAAARVDAIVHDRISAALTRS